MILFTADPLGNSFSTSRSGADDNCDEAGEGEGDSFQDEVIDYDQGDGKLLQMALQDYLRKIDEEDDD